MRWLACLLLSGCSALFGLDEPTRMRDAGIIVGADADASSPDAGADASLDAAIDAPLSCPAGYTMIGNSGTYYRLVTQQAQWEGAVADCADDGASTHLVVAGSLAEVTAIDTAFPGENELWIGLSDLVTNGTFLWVTAEDTMGFPPATGTPWQNQPGADPCVLVKDGVFETRSCTLTRRYLCECDAYRDDPDRY